MRTLAVALMAVLLASCGGAAIPSVPEVMGIRKDVIAWTWTPDKVWCNGIGDMFPADGDASCEWKCGYYLGSLRSVRASWVIAYEPPFTRVFAAPVVETGDCH